MNRQTDTAVVVPVETEADVDDSPEQTAGHRNVQTYPLDWAGVLAQQGYVFGVDISAEGERVALADVRGVVIARASHERPASAGQGRPVEVVDGVCQMMGDLLREHEIKPRDVLRAAVGFGGPVDARLGLVRMSHGSAGWEGYPVAARIESLFDVPTFLENDARLAALGEVWFGVGAGNPDCDLVYVHWSTGVGGGLVADGRLLRGANTVAGEIGHTTVRTGEDALPCRCGGRGHLEAYVRAPALLERARVAAPDFAPQTLTALLEAAASNDALSALVDEAVSLMAMTVANIACAVNPNLVVIGGRVVREVPALLDRVATSACDYPMPVTSQGLEIAPASLGEDATLMGAVALALASLR